MLRRTWILLVCIVLAPAAKADTIQLTNGDRISGTLDSISAGRALIATDYAGLIPVKLDAIASIQTEAAFNIHTSQGTVQGRLEVVDGVQQIAAETSTTPVELAQISRAGQNKLSLTRFTGEWTSRADLSAAVSNGNTDTQNFNTLLESTFKEDSVEHKVTLLVSKEEAEEETTKDTLDLDYGYKRFVSDKWYASGNAEYFRDKLKDIDQRITLGAGMGYQVWDNSFGALSTDLGVSAVQEDLDGEDESNPAVRWGLDYKRFLFSKKLELFHSQSVLFIPDSDRGEVFESSSGLRFALNDRIDTTFRVDVNHETDPPPDASKTDVTYSLGVGIKF